MRFPKFWKRDRCFCCGTAKRLLWSEGDHSLALRTVCVECKFGACSKCR